MYIKLSSFNTLLIACAVALVMIALLAACGGDTPTDSPGWGQSDPTPRPTMPGASGPVGGTPPAQAGAPPSTASLSTETPLTTTGPEP